MVVHNLLRNVHLAVCEVRFHKLAVRIDKTVKYEIVWLGKFVIKPLHYSIFVSRVHVLEFLLGIEILVHNFEGQMFCNCLCFILGHLLSMFSVNGLNVILDAEQLVFEKPLLIFTQRYMIVRQPSFRRSLRRNVIKIVIFGRLQQFLLSFLICICSTWKLHRIFWPDLNKSFLSLCRRNQHILDIIVLLAETIFNLRYSLEELHQVLAIEELIVDRWWFLPTFLMLFTRSLFRVQRIGSTTNGFDDSSLVKRLDVTTLNGRICALALFLEIA